MSFITKAFSPLSWIWLPCAFLITQEALGDMTNWNNNPMNFENSSSNFQNSPNNWENSPSNWKNSPNNYNSTRIIRDTAGHAEGYAVPKPDGGVNYFDLQGHREGYQGARGADD